MKTTLLVLFLLCALTAFGQGVAVAGALSSEPVRITFTSHNEHAAPQPMLQEQSLLVGSGYTYAQGERPLWEVAAASESKSLGEIARLLKKEHETAKKATVVMEK
jgi:hypothetical protein